MDPFLHPHLQPRSQSLLRPHECGASPSLLLAALCSQTEKTPGSLRVSACAIARGGKVSMQGEQKKRADAHAACHEKRPLSVGDRSQTSSAVVCGSVEPTPELVIEADEEEDTGQHELNEHHDARTRQEAKGKVLQHEVHRDLVAELAPVDDVQHNHGGEEETGQQRGIARVVHHDANDNGQQENQEAPAHARELSQEHAENPIAASSSSSSAQLLRVACSCAPPSTHSMCSRPPLAAAALRAA
eukprot:CAMPEP_0179417798 /NCGR_PEP_ID=MMETSP0799-20121207/7570_1 /TAXON_ID=46947 /ORGANISM="Geminigera cryophila, Strain CCMP2564" /LENGTH=243 /DNA_ID=CAMNT_0021190853 /DNA_START=337 /DNA_END=1069 /DNA_ORIENTATION=+